jgi:hypothetical protein
VNWLDEQKEQDEERDKNLVKDDDPLWLRLLKSVRPSPAIEINKKTGKAEKTIGIEGGAEF